MLYAAAMVEPHHVLFVDVSSLAGLDPVAHGVLP